MSAGAEHRKRPVTTVELAHRHQVQARNQQTNPRRHVERIDRRIRIQRHAKQFRQQTKQERIVEEDQPFRTVSLDRRPNRQNPRHCHRQSDYKPRKRPSQSNIKQRSSRRDRRTNLDKRAKRSREKDRRRRNEVRQGRVNFVMTAREIVAPLMREKNREQRTRERRALNNQMRIVDRIPEHLRAPVKIRERQIEQIIERRRQWRLGRVQRRTHDHDAGANRRDNRQNQETAVESPLARRDRRQSTFEVETRWYCSNRFRHYQFLRS